ILRYTRNQRDVDTQMKHYSNIREGCKDAVDGDSIRLTENDLQKLCRSTLKPAEFKLYIQARKEAHASLDSFYNETLARCKEPQHQQPDPNDRKGKAPEPLDNQAFTRQPLHRKRRLSAYWNQKAADLELARKLRETFGGDPVLVMGNLSAGMVRYHEPIRGKGWRRVLKQHGFHVYLIDEFRSSSICPVCNHGLETFRYVRNPRSWQLDNNPWVKCHGLLRCQNENCLESVAGPEGFKRRRLWNRDIAAVLNLKHILVDQAKAQSWAEYKRKEKRKAKREAKAAAPPKQLSAKRLFADVDSSGSDDEVSLIKLLKDVRRRG
ncbi:hypothetical protein LPJ57_008482, partial [Coemansia sp. RSA 486]